MGQRMAEAISINNSLTVLGRCIRAVGRAKSHVPWRDAILCQLLRTSFETKAAAGTHTAVVVNVSPEHQEETLCTLRFGETVAGVVNRSTAVVGQSANKEIHQFALHAAHLRAKALEMERDGQSGGFVKDCTKTEKRSLQANQNKLKSFQKELVSMKTKLVESGGKRVGLQVRIKALTKEEHNLEMLVLRQKSIKSLWRYPSTMYNALAAELLETEQQLAILRRTR